MRDWFESLDQREQIFVSGGAIVVVIAMIYAFIWVPLDSGQRTLAASVASWERSLAELKPLKGMQPVTSGATGQVTSRQTPVVIVDQTLRARGLDRSLKRSSPTTSNGIRVEFEGVAFDELVLWLGDLSNQYDMHVTIGSLSTTTDAGAGRVNATFTLERG